MLNDLVNMIVSLVSDWGYLGIFLLMALESSFFPFPSEVVMIPAGYLAWQGEMNLFYAFISGTLGSLFGALFNYFLCYFWGRTLIQKYGKFIGITHKKMLKFEKFFNKYGDISTFNSRLIPGIRQYISLPAGIAKMNIIKFSIYTSLGAGIWSLILLTIGYFIGDQQDRINEYLKIITYSLIAFVIMLSAIYIKIRKIKLKNLYKRI